MHARSRRPPRYRAWAVPLLALAVAGVVSVAIWRPWVTPETAVAAGVGTTPVLSAPTPLELPDDPTVLIFGDSWTYGSAASVPTLGYAYVVAQDEGWKTIVDGVRGSGYLKPGLDGPDYGTRIAALDAALQPDLVIVQGSINDRYEPESGYRAAVDAAWNALATTYPDAQIVVLGPAPQVLPLERETARIDRDLAAAAAARGWWYISPAADDWITPDNYASVIDTGAGRNHPTTAGHRYLAERLARAIDAISR